MTAALDAPPLPPRRRPTLVPLPSCEPPFDDELPHGGASGATGITPAAAPAHHALQAVPPLAPPAPAPTARESPADAAIRGDQPTPPPVQRFGSVLARALIEALSGRRPVAQLRVHCAPEVYTLLAARPALPTVALPHLISVRVCEPAAGVAEICAVFRRSERVRAMAFRLTWVEGRWLVSALQVC